MSSKKTFLKDFKGEGRSGVLSFESMKKGHTASKNLEHRFCRQKVRSSSQKKLLQPYGYLYQKLSIPRNP